MSARHHLGPRPAQRSWAAESLLEQIDQTDAGNVAQLAELTLGDLRYVRETNVWIHWDGTKWIYDHSQSKLHRMALAVADAYEQKAKQLDKQTNRTNLGEMGQKLLAGEIRSLQKWAIKCRSRSTIDSMIALAQRDERFVISASELDRDPDLLGVENGVVHLPSGTLRPENKGDFILRRSPVPFDCSASTFSIERFVQEITALPGGIENGKLTFHPRPELSHYVQKLCGYCLTARTQEQVMFILCGKGANGKSVLVDLLKEVSGEYCEVIPPEVLLATKGVAGAEQANPSTRKLAGARCAITSESNEGASLDVAVVKRHTGDARMTARALYQNPTTFDITHKLVLLTNHPPRVEKMDDAVRGRLQVVPFDMRWNRPGTVAYDPTLPDANKNLLAEFKRDLRGVLKFFVDGAKAYYAEGLNPPPEVAKFTQHYMAEQDNFRRWLDEACISCGEGEGETAQRLFEYYRHSCTSRGEMEHVSSVALLGRRLNEMGHIPRKTRVGMRYGIRLKEALDRGAP